MSENLNLQPFIRLCTSHTYIFQSKSSNITSKKACYCLPLPIEIVKELQAKSGLEATNLDSCFKMDLKKLKKEVRKYTYTITNSSHKPFLTRLYWAYGRFVLDICQDENYAAAITTDFSLGTIANFSYMVVKPEKINSICQKVYSELGLSGRFLKSPLPCWIV